MRKILICNKKFSISVINYTLHFNTFLHGHTDHLLCSNIYIKRMFKNRKSSWKNGKQKLMKPLEKLDGSFIASNFHSRLVVGHGKDAKGHHTDKALLQPSALINFDSCVEACDALAANSGRNINIGSDDNSVQFGDCSVMVSPDGALLFLPKDDGEFGSLQSPASTDALDVDCDEVAAICQNSTEPSLRISPRSSPRGSPTSTPHEFLAGEEYESAIVMGKDMTLHGDKIANGFSAKGWNAGMATMAIRKAEETLKATSSFLEELILSRKASAASASQACERLRDVMVMQHSAQIEAKYSSSNDTSHIKTENLDESLDSQEDPVAVNIPSASEMVGRNDLTSSTSTNNKMTPVQKSQSGPLLFPGSTLYNALIAVEEFHSKVAEGDAHRWRAASRAGSNGSLDGSLHIIQEAVFKTNNRANLREKALLESQLRAEEIENVLKVRKQQAKKLWTQVQAVEDEVQSRLEEITLEKSRMREQQRRKKQNERQAAVAMGKLESTVTQQEIWELVSKVDLDSMSFAPTGLPDPSITGPVDRMMKSNLSLASDNDSINRESITTATSENRAEIEASLGLDDFRKAAVQADEDIQDAAGALLNVMSQQDTSKRSARVAAEACLLSAANSYVKSLRSLVEVEREAIEERLRELVKLEEKLDKIDIRSDLNMFIEHEKLHVPHGSTRLGEDDDGGVASALAVLNCHYEGIGSGIGVMGMAELSSFSGWGGNKDKEDVYEREELDEAVETLFGTVGANTTLESLQSSVQFLVKAVKEKTLRARGYRASTIVAINNHRGKSSKIRSEEQFEGLCDVLNAVLTGCDRESADIATAKMCMMLAQTFYVIRKVEGKADDDRTQRFYAKSKLYGHTIWYDEDFWVQALFQCVTEALTNSGVMSYFENTSRNNDIKWYDLSPDERAEAASQVHAVVFAQLGALAHSMMEFGCSIEQACAFVRRLSVRHQLPMNQRAMLLSHLINNGSEKELEN